jgi:hypothetical protein
MGSPFALPDQAGFVKMRGLTPFSFSDPIFLIIHALEFPSTDPAKLSRPAKS